MSKFLNYKSCIRKKGKHTDFAVFSFLVKSHI